MQVDILGREVKVGDIVVSTNNSSTYGQIHVVTRLGASEKIQVNGASYVNADYMMVCTEQYILAKGQEAADALVAEYREFFNEKKVEKKAPSPKFMVYRYQDYARKLSARYFVVRVQGAGKECYKQVAEFFSKADVSEFGQYFDRKSLNKHNHFTYSDIGHAMSLTRLKELKLDGYIDSEVPAEHFDSLLVI